MKSIIPKFFGALNRIDYTVIEALKLHKEDNRPSQAHLASICEVSLSTVKRSLRKLEGFKLLSKQKSSSILKPKIYKLHLKQLTVAAMSCISLTTEVIPAEIFTPQPPPIVRQAIITPSGAGFQAEQPARSAPIKIAIKTNPPIISSIENMSTAVTKITVEMIPADLQPAATQIVDWWNNNRKGQKTERAFNLQIEQFRKIIAVAQLPGLIKQIEKAILSGQMGNRWQAIMYDNYIRYGTTKSTDRNLSATEKAAAQAVYNNINRSKHYTADGIPKSVIKAREYKAISEEEKAIWEVEKIRREECKKAGIEFVYTKEEAAAYAKLNERLAAAPFIDK